MADSKDTGELIKMTGIEKVYTMGSSSFKALDNVSLSISKGEYAAIVGPSGAGKSTLMHIIGCLDTPTRGEYILDGMNTKCGDNRLAEIRNKKIGFVFQNYNLLPKLNIYENVELPLLFSDLTDSAIRERTRTAIERVGLTSHTRHKPTELSGGQMQRVAIARALVTEPQIILADEPTGALDSATGREVLKMLTELNSEGNTIIMITHDREIASYARRMITVKDGKITSDSSHEKEVVA
jgi:putative ABC transport system ATP-binding protein